MKRLILGKPGTGTSPAVGKIALMMLMSISAGLSSSIFAGQDDNCVVQISQPLVDYGRKTAAELIEGRARTSQIFLGKQTISLSAVCENKTGLALSFNGQGADDHSYRFARNGSFTLKVLSTQLDGKSVRMLPAEAPATSSSEQRLRPGVSLVAYDGQRPATGERLTVQVEVETYIDPEATKVRAEEVWEGGGQFNVESFN
ncbi:hypothetical protein RBU55_21600 [Pseudomonas chlororaphis subsp. aurantiaca]|uniref:hypothetical protein n=1 Tax=Pseudomonas chlororaphis TaxID=587753 RepID=UPI0027DB9ADD|nr:hypothetical protein [Pseudomonas chlororaphis]WMI98146.1 hypothetical protein RBU55_21600 [Pseudomonas chlororaphis subsp. aurantiaca]